MAESTWSRSHLQRGDTAIPGRFTAAAQQPVRPQLLQKQLEVDKIRIQGLELNLARAADGRSNWDDLAGGAEAAEPGVDKQEPGAQQEIGAKQVLGGLAIGGVELQDSRVVWDDQAAGQRYEIADLSLDTEAFVPGQPLSLALGFRITGSQPALKARVNLDTQVQTDPRLKQIELSPLNLKLSQIEAEGVTGDIGLAAPRDVVILGRRTELRAGENLELQSALRFFGHLLRPALDPLRHRMLWRDEVGDFQIDRLRRRSARRQCQERATRNRGGWRCVGVAVHNA